MTTTLEHRKHTGFSLRPRTWRWTCATCLMHGEWLTSRDKAEGQLDQHERGSVHRRRASAQQTLRRIKQR